MNTLCNIHSDAANCEKTAKFYDNRKMTYFLIFTYPCFHGLMQIWKQGRSPDNEKIKNLKLIRQEQECSSFLRLEAAE